MKDCIVFVKKAEWLRPVLESSNDAGQNVFNDLVLHKDATHTLETFCDNPTQLNFERANVILLKSSFYAQAKASAKKELEAHKRHT